MPSPLTKEVASGDTAWNNITVSTQKPQHAIEQVRLRWCWQTATTLLATDALVAGPTCSPHTSDSPTPPECYFTQKTTLQSSALELCQECEPDTDPQHFPRFYIHKAKSQRVIGLVSISRDYFSNNSRILLHHSIVFIQYCPQFQY